MIKNIITDSATRHSVKVTSIGQLVTSPYAYSEVTYLLLDTAAQGYTFFKPKSGEQFVLTGFGLTADSNVVTSCVVDIYESAAQNSATIAKSIFHFEILKNGYRDSSGLNVLISEGVFLNAKTDDDDVYCTILGYYIPKL